MMANQRSIKSFFKVMDNFCKQSGFKINYDKTTVFRIGSYRKSDAKHYSEKELHWSKGPINVLGVLIHHENILKINYEPIIRKAQTILNTWKRRNLSLIGKIIIVNTLISSLFVYKMLVLPQIPKEYLIRMEGMITEFIWSGRKAKISLKSLQLQKDDGGQNLVDLMRKDRALKLTWLGILESDDKAANLFYNQVKNGVQSILWKANFEASDVDNIFEHMDIFWKDVLKAWALINYQNYIGENQMIWLHSKIRIGGKPVFWKHLYDKGLTYINQILNKGKIISYETLYNEFGLSRMQYNSLTSAMKSLRIDMEEKQESEQLYDIFKQQKFSSKWAYNRLAKESDFLLVKLIKWKDELSFNMSLEEFKTEFRNINTTTNITKLRSFQYRLLHRAIVTNIHLKKWKIKDSALCEKCGLEVETLSHMFVTCNKLAEF